MNNDGISIIGKSHTICEDYVKYECCDNNNFPVVVLCDGCSLPKMKDRDTGVRLIASDIKKRICKSNLFDPSNPAKHSPYSSIAHAVKEAVVEAARQAKDLQLPPECIDATVMLAYANNEKVNVFSFGDGVIVAKHKGGFYRMWDLSFPSGIPYYMSYETDTDRLHSMLETTKGNPRTQRYYEGTTVNEELRLELQDESISYQPSWDFEFDVNQYEWVSLLSDGVHSYHIKDESGAEKPMPFTVAIRGLLNFKTFAGEFVKRTVLAYEKNCTRNRVWHHDDVSVASIYLES